MRRPNDMPWLKRGVPIFDDVRFGKGGIAGGKFVQNEAGVTAIDLGALLIDDTGDNFLLVTDDGTRITLS